MDGLRRYVEAIVAGRHEEVQAPAPVLPPDDHLLVACAIWTMTSDPKASPRALAAAIGLDVDNIELPDGVPYLVVGRTILCSTVRKSSARGLRTLAGIAFVALRARKEPFSIADVWLVARQLAQRGAEWRRPSAKVPPASAG